MSVESPPENYPSVTDVKLLSFPSLNLPGHGDPARRVLNRRSDFCVGQMSRATRAVETSRPEPPTLRPLREDPVLPTKTETETLTPVRTPSRGRGHSLTSGVLGNHRPWTLRNSTGNRLPGPRPRDAHGGRVRFPSLTGILQCPETVHVGGPPLHPPSFPLYKESRVVTPVSGTKFPVPSHSRRSPNGV